MNSSLSHNSNSNVLQEFIFRARYARYVRFLGRRENWPEAVSRVRAMHEGRFSHLGSKVLALLDESFGGVETKEVLPSMRTLQFAGNALLAHEARGYNCSATHISRTRAFAEAFYLLLCGCGVGFSVQKEHISQLPALAPRGQSIVTHIVEDTIEGWANALDTQIENAVAGVTTLFDFSLIRPKGALLKTSGGRAPGHEPLKEALSRIERVLVASQGRQLRSIEAYDILMFAAKAVLSGGVRRSATICLFSADDVEMMNAKSSADWFDINPQRAASNNSAVLIRGKATREQFDALFEAQKSYGEPGFFFADDVDSATNPCCEIALHPVFVVRNDADLALAARYGVTVDDSKRPLHIGSRCSGVQFCNLVTINGGQVKSAEDFYRACRKAAIIGTFQAAYTNTPYLSPVSRLLNERESLLGVSICGILDNPEVMLNPEVLRKGAEIVKATNAEVADLLGINAAARTTCVKPEGTTSLLLNTGSGIHPHHSVEHFRRIQMNANDPVLHHFKKFNPQMVEPSLYGTTDEVVTFPVTIAPTAKTRADFTALEFMKAVILVQQNWVVPGTAHQKYAPGIHNVSNTVNVKDGEWDEVREFIWANRNNITGMSTISDKGDKVYKQAPRETVVTDEDKARFLALAPNEVDWDSLREFDDNTTVKQTVACAGGQCELHV